MADCKICNIERILLALQQNPGVETLSELLAEIQVEPSKSMAQCGMAQVLPLGLCAEHIGHHITVYQLIDSAEIFRGIDGSIRMNLMNKQFPSYRLGECKIPWEWPVRIGKHGLFIRLISGRVLVAEIYGPGRDHRFLYLPKEAKLVDRHPMNLILDQSKGVDIYQFNSVLTYWREDQSNKTLDQVFGDSELLLYDLKSRALISKERNQ